MQQDLAFFGPPPSSPAKALPDAAALDRYTYLVAGVVGRFWTELLWEIGPHWSSASFRADQATMTAWGINYGKGLQLINILRDLPRDLTRGRCYLPADGLAKAGLKPDDLKSPAAFERLQPLYDHWWEQSRTLLKDGERYLAALPPWWLRIRTATALPLRLGYATLALLQDNPEVLNPNVVIKVPRRHVHRLLLWNPMRAQGGS
jgi:farnesyl-diphosphate farnesyltransferase